MDPDPSSAGDKLSNSEFNASDEGLQVEFAEELAETSRKAQDKTNVDSRGEIQIGSTVEDRRGTVDERNESENPEITYNSKLLTKHRRKWNLPIMQDQSSRQNPQ